ncbi:MAG: ribosomal-protein-alanine N-acetyltransferase [Neptuniibacter caesariensis]|uniref:[Ribosomal protein bS18]-alanine N-acetyltransferase n=1 Tax=Neptuniibacter caesariensis TaxID=207954 RepID=A0A2G6JNK6_NEPCE|nr:MAG: ribosomal-protein-alanine N-acetyltransferase [Neptuniibacter caesariensis]
MSDFKQLIAADLACLIALEGACFSSPWSEGQLKSFLGASPTRFVLGWFNPELSGFAAFSVVLDEAELLQIGIHPAAQGCGNGRRLLKESLAILRQKGATRLYLEVRASNLAAIKMYQKVGFSKTGVRKSYYPPVERGCEPEDALLMSLVL